MQELRSTEILDKEIHADAVKKAEKILKKADEDCESILQSIDVNIAKAAAEKDDFYNKKIAAFEKDQNASIPLEKQRFEVSFIQESISKKINDYLKSLSEEKRISLVLKQIDSDFEFIKDKKLNAFVYGFDLKKIEKELSAKFGKSLAKCEKTEFGKISIEDELVELREGIILESEDKAFRCRLTLSEVIVQLLDKNRGALSAALFGVGGIA